MKITVCILFVRNRVRNCAFLVANVTKNFALATDFHNWSPAGGLRRDFFELRALHSQKDHNNLLPRVKISWNHVCFAPGYDFDGRFDHFYS